MCPACKKPMIALELEGIEIDHCLDCGGTWLDAGEIEAISERAGGDPGKLANAIDAAADGPRGLRRCPRCRRKLRTIRPARQASFGNPVTTPGRVTAASQALRANTVRTSSAKLSSGSIG